MSLFDDFLLSVLIADELNEQNAPPRNREIESAVLIGHNSAQVVSVFDRYGCPEHRVSRFIENDT